MSHLRDVLARLPEIKARAEKATPGPWWSLNRSVCLEREGFDQLRPVCVTKYTGTRGEAEANAHLIAAARTDVPVLVEALDEARELLAGLAGDDAERIAHDLDHMNIDRSRWYRAVKRARKALGR